MSLDKEDIKNIAMAIYDAIFNNLENVKIENNEIPIKKFSSGIRYIDYGGYRFIEQNRNKPSQWGKKARKGHKIMWVIKGRRYIARIFDGEFIFLGK
ncbi:MAG: hypothetical protein ACP6IY_20815 [Promethearchaeia archaeon]